MKPTTIAAAAGILLLTSCRAGANSGDQANRPDSAAPAAQEPGSDSTSFRVTGTIHAVNLEGGCWRFDAEDGRHFEISKATAPADLLVDGKRATLTLKPRSDMMSTCMIGSIAEVVAVEP